MKNTNFLLLLLLFTFAQAYTQAPLIIEGYVYEENDRGFLGGAEVQLFTSQMMKVEQTITDAYGHFKFTTVDDRKYVVRAAKKLYFQNEQKVDPAGKNEDNKLFLKMEMERQPGYIFDVTLAEPRSAPDAPTNSVQGASIEIYNNTTKKMVWVSEKHPSPYFKFTFEQGNHYTIMISKEGYISKQIEAYVNVNGCIICIEGVDNVKPGVVDNLTEGHQKGTLLANIELQPIKIGEKIPVDNLYYGSSQYKVTKSMHKSLDALTVLLINNKNLIVELTAHTDAKGDDKFNQKLSLKRTKAAVDYILKGSNIEEYRLKAVGKGESSPINKCKNNVPCSDKQHAQNRRTELVITGLLANTHVSLPLTKIKDEERIANLLDEVLGGEQIEIPAGGEMPEDLKRQLEAEQQAKGVKAKTEAKPKQKIDNVESSRQKMIDAKKHVKEAVKPQIKKPEGAEKDAEARAKKAFRPNQPAKELNPPEKKVKTQTVPTMEKKVSELEETLPTQKVETKKQNVKELEAAEVRAKKAFKPNQPVKELDMPVQSKEVLKKEVKAVVKIIDEMKVEKKTDVKPEVDEPQKEMNSKIISEVDLGDEDVHLKIMEVSTAFTGYRVQIKRTSYELPNSDVVFKTYTDVVFYRPANGDYIYLTGNFATRTIGKIGLEYVKRTYPKARLRLFKKGKLIDL